jgi:hypothetical protein
MQAYERPAGGVASGQHTSTSSAARVYSPHETREECRTALIGPFCLCACLCACTAAAAVAFVLTPERTMLALEVWLEICSRTVTYVPSILRLAAICLLFLYAWSLNIRGFEKAHIPFRMALGFKKMDGDAHAISSLCKFLFGWLILCLGLHEALLLQDLQRAKNFPLLLFWTAVIMFFGKT